MRWLVAFAVAVAVLVAGCGHEPAETVEAAPGRAALTVQLGHSYWVSSAAFSPDERHVVTSGADGVAILWERETGREVRRLEGHDEGLYSAMFSSDGRHLLTSSSDKTARLWEADTGREVRRYEGHEDYLISASFSPDGRHVLSVGYEGTVILWDTETAEEVRRFEGHEQHVTSAEFSPDGAYVLTASWDETARLWETATGREIRRFVPQDGWVLNAVFSAGGRAVLTTNADGSPCLWDTETGRPIRQFPGHEAPVLEVAVAPDGRHFLALIGYVPRLWVTDSGREVLRFEGHSDQINSLVFSQDGRHVLTASHDGTARIWETATGQEVRRFEGHADWARSAVFAPSGQHILTAIGEGGASLWEVKSGRELRKFLVDPEGAASDAFSPDGRYVLSRCANQTVLVWDPWTVMEVTRLKGHDFPILCAVFSPDGRQVLSASEMGTAILWEVATGREVRRYEGPLTPVNTIAFSSDGSRLVMGCGESWKKPTETTVIVWDTDTGREVRHLGPNDRPVTDVALSPDGTHVLTGCGAVEMERSAGAARLWEVESGKEVRRFEGHTDQVNSVMFSPDGRHVLTGSLDGSARLWETGSAKEVRRFEGHTLGVGSAGFAPDGRHILTTSADKTTRLWEVETGRELCALLSFTGGPWVVITPDGRFDTADLEETVGLHWVMSDDPMRAYPIELFMRDYYEPRLLPRLLAGEEMAPVKELTALNRAQPAVEIVSIEAGRGTESTVSVTVEIESSEHALGRGAGRVVQQSGVHDLLLFRDGQIVGSRDGDLDVGDVRERITFEDIRVPARGEETEVEFSAYAFNGDGVKSRTARSVFRASPSAQSWRGRAYVVGVGVDRFAESAWDLSCAAADAKLFVETLGEALQRTKAWARVVPVLLVSTAETNNARKKDLRAALKNLAGQVRPEDLVIVAISTHGLATADGGFLLLPSDAVCRDTGEVLQESCISTGELEAWLRPVDAGEMALIVDACQSAASVEREGFKPGPMGSRGFGQLAWNKKMRILTASQASEYALESRQLRHGLLTHALVREGLEEGKADAGETPDGLITLQEWLEYGASRVPALADDITSGAIEAIGPRGPLREENRPEVGRLVQRPALFDFSRAERQVTVIRGR